MLGAEIELSDSRFCGDRGEHRKGGKLGGLKILRMSASPEQVPDVSMVADISGTYVRRLDTFG